MKDHGTLIFQIVLCFIFLAFLPFFFYLAIFKRFTLMKKKISKDDS